MSSKNYKENIKTILIGFDSMLNDWEILSKEYEVKLSNQNSKNITTFNNDTKAIVSAFYDYIAKSTNTLYFFEAALSMNSLIIVEAEKACDDKAISLCDEIQKFYEEIKSELGTFIKTCEGEIAKTKGNPQASVMSGLLEGFRRKCIYVRQKITSLLNNFEA